MAIFPFTVTPDETSLDVELRSLSFVIVGQSSLRAIHPFVCDAPISYTPLPVPPLPLAFSGESTLRGGTPVVMTQYNVLDTTRDEPFRSVTLPAAWTEVNVGSGAVWPTRAGLVLDTGVSAGSIAGVQSAETYQHFDIAVDVELQRPVGPLDSPVDLAVLEARAATSGFVQVRLQKGVGQDPEAVVVFGEFTVDGVTTAGGIALPPSTPRVTLRIVRNGSRIFGFAAVRSTYVDGYDTLVKVVDYDQFLPGAGRVRFYVQNLGRAQRVQSQFTNFTVRSHCTIGGRLLDNKVDVSARRLTGTVPAAPVTDLGLVDVKLFGVFGEAISTDGLRYVLPFDRTIGRSADRALITVQDAVLRDGGS